MHIPGELANCPLESRAQVVGGALEFPARSSARRRTGDHPAPVSIQLANSPTFAKLPRAGQPRRSGPHHRGPRGGSGPHPAAAAPKSTRQSREKAATRGAQRAAADPQEGGAGRAARRGSGAVGATAIPPVAAVLWPSPAPRLASGGSAAELERGRHRGRFSSRSCCRRRADGRTRGAGGGAANPAGRGGADRPR